MDDFKDDRHPSVCDLVDYFGGRLPSKRENELDLHFGWCDDCAASASRVRLLSHIVDGWSATGYHRAIAESRVVRALERASVAPACAPWRDRLSRWAEVWVGRSEAALRVTLRQTGDSVQAHVVGLVDLTRSGALWPQFVPRVALPLGALPTRGAPKDTDVVVSASEDAPRVHVAAQGVDGRIEVDIEGIPAGPAPLAMLVPDDAAGPVLLGQLSAGQIPSHLVAVFEKVGVG